MINLSDTTPAPSANHTNITWQKNSSGDVSAQFPTPVDAATQAANKVLAGPMTGSAATPAFRLLVAADVPAIPESQVTNLTTDLALLAPLASPTFTGTPAAPTPSTADNSTKLATTAYVQAQGFGTGSAHKYATSWTSQTSVTVTHSLVTKDVIVQVYDASDVLVIPESVTTTSTSVVTLTFGASFSGRVVVIG